MPVKKVIIDLSPEETLCLLRILMDEDKDDAMRFLKQTIKPKLDDQLRQH